ncbi:MAG: hypothetical protein ACW99A_06355, partial [Candidatus Kariarchaeaceae archaeon]
MRTKLRLDLNEVQKQIEDIEDQMRSDKSSETIDRHKKLIEYEKKLKDQYEKIAGITIDQASQLEEKKMVAPFVATPSEARVTKIFGFIAGLLLFNGFYNLTIHAYEGYSPTDYLDYLNGNANAVTSFSTLAAGWDYESSSYLIAGPLVGGIALLLIGLIFSRSGSKLFKFMEIVGISIPVGFLFYLMLDGSTSADV